MRQRGAANSAPRAPRPLRPLEKMLAGIGFRLAIPFDDIRRPGYIGVYDHGREVILDDGSSLEPFVRVQRRSVVLGDTSRLSQFYAGGFLRTFGDLVGFRAVQVKRVSLSFPRRFVPSEYIAITDVEEDLYRLTPACRRALQAPGSFLIVQTLETDSIEYRVECRARINAAAKRRIDDETARRAAESEAEFHLGYESENSYSLTLVEKPMTVAYKPYRLQLSPAPA